MDMTDRYEEVIRKQDALIAELEKQLESDQVLIDAQNRQIRLLQEQAALLEKEKQSLIAAGNEMSAACERFETLCKEQQEVIKTFSNIFEEP